MAADWTFSIRFCSPVKPSGSQAMPLATAKNLPLASVQIGTGVLDTPTTCHSVIGLAALPLPTIMVVSFSARASPPGSSAIFLPGLASSRSMNHALVSIGPPMVV